MILNRPCPLHNSTKVKKFFIFYMKFIRRTTIAKTILPVNKKTINGIYIDMCLNEKLHENIKKHPAPIAIPIIRKTVNLHIGFVQLRFHCSCYARNENLVIILLSIQRVPNSCIYYFRSTIIVIIKLSCRNICC